MSLCQCGAVLPPCGGPTHRYIVSTPECWALYWEVLAREYQDPALFAEVHQLTVDAYAAQHPLQQPAKSLAAHLISLYALVDQGKDHKAGIEVKKALLEGRNVFPEFCSPKVLGSTTVVEVASAKSGQQHRDLVHKWAAQVWSAWNDQHASIAALAEGRV